MLNLCSDQPQSLHETAAVKRVRPGSTTELTSPAKEHFRQLAESGHNPSRSPDFFAGSISEPWPPCARRLTWSGNVTVELPLPSHRPDTATLPLPDNKMSTSNFTVTFEAYDRLNKRNLYFKADGKRFDNDRTLKVCCDVKYDLTVTVKPSVAPLE